MGDNNAIVSSSLALVARVRGQEALDVRQFQGDPALVGLGGRSGNWPWVAAAASGDLAWTAKALAQERISGLGNAELGAIGYSSYLICSKVYLLKLASAQGHPVRAELASNLRATLALSALAAGPTAVKTLVVHLHDGSHAELQGNAKWRSGMTVCLPAPRQNLDFDNDLLSGAASWAFRVPGAAWKRKYNEHNSAAVDLWPIEVLERTMGVAYGEPTPPESWGLDAVTRRAWRAGTPPELSQLIATVGTWRTAAEIRIIRTEGGVIAGLEGQGLSTFKPSALVKSVDIAGVAELSMPARWSAGNASRGESHLLDGAFVAGADGIVIHHPIPAGAELYRLAIGPSGPLRLIGAAPAVSPPLIQPPSAPPPPSKPSPGVTTVPDGMAMPTVPAATLTWWQRLLQAAAGRC